MKLFKGCIVFHQAEKALKLVVHVKTSSSGPGLLL